MPLKTRYVEELVSIESVVTLRPYIGVVEKLGEVVLRHRPTVPVPRDSVSVRSNLNDFKFQMSFLYVFSERLFILIFIPTGNSGKTALCDDHASGTF
ncbi:hypothetical protein TNCV_5094831 [Trichonephila clavipes]|nr:hypothetical protein TNCV_5094831 [Trichonephila clavipes]